MRPMSIALITAVAVVLFGQVLYHVVAKTLGQDKNPWEIITVSYFFGFLFVLATGLIFKKIDILEILSLSNFGKGIKIALAISCVELGYIYAYRSGLPISVGALGVLALTTAVLFPVGVVLFGESNSGLKYFGVVLTLLGVFLLSVGSKA